MTVALAPGLMTSPASPANAPPPGTPSNASSADPTGTFAALLTAAQAAKQGGDTGPPDGGAASMPDATTEAEALLASLLALMRGVTTEDAADGTTDLPTLDRLAEAGETNQEEAGAAGEPPGVMEALMAYLVMGQRTTEQAAMLSLPDDVRALLHTMAAADAADTSADLALDAATARIEVTGVAASTTDAGGIAPPAIATAAQAAELASTTGDGIEAPVAPLVAATVEGDATGMPADGDTPPLVTADAIDDGGTQPGRPDVTEDGAPTTATAAEVSSTRVGAGQGVADAAARTQPDAGGDAAARTAAAAVTPPMGTVASGASDTPRVETVAQARVVDAASLPGDVADTVRLAVMRGDSEIRVVLNPPELGHLDIRIATHEGGLRVSLEAAQAGARDVLERSLPALLQSLEARELRVERLEVRAADTGRGSLDTSGSGHGPAGDGARDGRDGGPDWSPVASFEPGQAGPSKPVQPSADGRVDVLA
ncbi:MAG: flagellar hook-length control protein FliK [Dehalococcoidia bacterium]